MERFRVTVAAVQADGHDSPIAKIQRVFVFDPGLDESWDDSVGVLAIEVAGATIKLVEAVSVVRPMVPDC